ncbi:TonB-dependent receptor [Pectinatus sottacetonis]|uniref:TonB-dependent receptor n=1 Tax=Pectinatus sottacetonis TaxID=1002795 RepID=UPI0018C76082|nr:TonB-dependent receptor plug domain-containing protein [Pectinatus sottacetonis]
MQRRAGKRNYIKEAAACIMALSIIIPSTAWADKAPDKVKKDDSGDEAAYDLGKQTVEAKRPDWEAKLSPGTVTIIRPDDYMGEQKTLPELLKQVPGVHVREVNGKGQYTTVSVRGSTTAQVGVFVDGVLFNLGGDAAADISTIPVDNVERIEVYRGYIPARFGGTYIGGVINIVTKRPTKAKAVASVGKSSFGGWKGNVEIDAPLGDGSVLVGLNRDQSHGDFKYRNFAVTDEIKKWAAETYEGVINPKDGTYNISAKRVYDILKTQNLTGMLNSNYRDMLSNFSSTEASKEQTIQLQNLWIGDTQFNEQMQAAINAVDQSQLTRRQKRYLNSGYYKAMDGFIENYNYAKGVLDATKSADHWRKSNDYKNTDAIVKWQDNHWLTKVTWKQIKRHLPFPLDGNYAPYWSIDTEWAYNYPRDWYYHRNQELTDKEALVGRRDSVGNLEWGWSVDYLKQNKKYYVDDWQTFVKENGVTVQTYSPNTFWSQYGSNKWTGQIDGSYKAGNNNLIEFLINGSKEKMNINGWRMFDYDFHSADIRKRWRNYYEQKLFNVQLQDTVTLNKAADFWLTPSIRYNRSTILGRSEWYDEKHDPQNVKWLRRTDEQTDDKVTWQLALKKQMNKNFTLRATGGSYFRLLNMYEIAGDGAGIWPMPNVGGTESVFPRPEEGKQWDLSAIWDGKVLGAKQAHLQLTYFGRDSKRILELDSWNHFFFVYNNAISGKINGAEMQADMSWQKWDLNLQGTYMQPRDLVYNDSFLPQAGYWQNNGVFKGVMTYQPRWEGTTRVTYRPDRNWSLFTQLRYVSDMYINELPLTTGEYENQSSLTTWDLGVKYKFNKVFQVALGVNDMFNKAIDMYNKYYFNDVENIKYPIAGRSYYLTLQYNY